MPIRVEVAGISTTAPARLAYIRTIEVAALTRDADAAARTASGRSR